MTPPCPECNETGFVVTDTERPICRHPLHRPARRLWARPLSLWPGRYRRT